MGEQTTEQGEEKRDYEFDPNFDYVAANEKVNAVSALASAAGPPVRRLANVNEPSSFGPPMPSVGLTNLGSGLLLCGLFFRFCPRYLYWNRQESPRRHKYLGTEGSFE